MGGDVCDGRPFDARRDVVPADGGSGVVAGAIEPVASLGGQVDPADERNPVVDHDRLLVVAMEWAFVAVECDLHLRVPRETVPHERDVFPRGAEQWKRRAGPGEHADVDALCELREEVAQDDVLSVPDERERGCEVPAGQVDVRVGAEKFLGHRRQRFGSVDQDVDRIAGARRRIRLGPSTRRRRKGSLPPDPAEPSPVVSADLGADPGSEPRLRWPGQSAQPASVLLKVRDWFLTCSELRSSHERGNPEAAPFVSPRLAVARRRSVGPPLLLLTALSATSAATPKRSMRPPKAIPQSTNQAQPSANPPITSLSQWKSSKTRLDATATAIPTAAPARTARAARGRRRPSSSAAAAQKAAAVVVCPLGNDGPERCRGRVERGPSPIDEVLDQGGDQLLASHYRDDERHQPPVRQPYKLDGDEQDHRPITTVIDPSSVIAVRACSENGVAWRYPQCATPVVDRGQGRVRPDEVGQSPEHHTCPDDEERPKGQPEPCLRLGIESRSERELEHRVPPRGAPDCLSRCDRRSHPDNASGRVPPRPRPAAVPAVNASRMRTRSGMTARGAFARTCCPRSPREKRGQSAWRPHHRGGVGSPRRRRHPTAVFVVTFVANIVPGAPRSVAAGPLPTDFCPSDRDRPREHGFDDCWRGTGPSPFTEPFADRFDRCRRGRAPSSPQGQARLSRWSVCVSATAGLDFVLRENSLHECEDLRRIACGSRDTICQIRE